VSIGITTRDTVVGHFEQGDALSTIIVSANSAASGGFFNSTVQETRNDAEKLTDDVVERLNKLANVTSVTPQVTIWELANFQIEGSETSYVSNTIASSQKTLDDSSLAAGEWFDNSDKSPKIVLGNGYLRALGITDPTSIVGKQLTFTTVKGYRGIGADIPSYRASSSDRSTFEQQRTQLTATIVGVTAPSVNDNRIYIPLEWGRLVETPRVSTPTGETTTDSIAKNGYTNIVVMANSKDAVPGIASDINNLGFGAITYQKQIDQINQLSLVMWVILGSVAFISLISASLGIINTLLMSVSEQKQTIQIWRSCGASRGMISRIYILQAIILSVIGATVGAAVGYIVCKLINSRLESVLSAQGLNSIQLPDVPLWIIGGSIIMSVVIAVIAALYPARVAARKIID
jgi:putative ABC transport system permease protein